MANEFSDDTLLARWLSGELSEAEQQELQARPDFVDFQRIATAGANLKMPSYNAATELVRLQARQEELKASAKVKKMPAKRSLGAIRYWSAAAAAVAILAVAWFLLKPESPQEIYAAAGTPSVKTNLRDGSVAQLNAGSRLTFAVEEQRLGNLEGEGFFEVEKSDIPFVVQTELGSVTVLGTSFNVYARGEDFRVSCSTGKVRVRFSGVDKPYELTPGMSVSRTGSNTVVEAATDEESTLDWLEGRSVFKSRPLAEVIAELERQFAVEVKLPSGFNVEKATTTSFVNTNLDQALAAVFEPVPRVSYLKEGRVISVTQQ